MGRRGNPYDNAKAESFMKTLKVEAVYLIAESEAKRPVIPTEGGHPIRSKAATDSDRRRPPC
jgi:transposase InsO family protein